MPAYRRKIKLIQPRLQLKLVLTFLGLSALALVLQFLLFSAALSQLASDLPEDGAYVMQELPLRLTVILAMSLAICLPLVFCVGVLVTFRIAGPMWRFEQFLRSVARGERPPDCVIRKEDELQEFCLLLNKATAPLRQPTLVLTADAERIERAA